MGVNCLLQKRIRHGFSGFRDQNGEKHNGKATNYSNKYAFTIYQHLSGETRILS